MKEGWQFLSGNAFKLKRYDCYISHRRFLRKNLEMSWLKNNQHWIDYMPHERFKERELKASSKRVKEFEAW